MGAPVAVAAGAQGHVETRHLHTKVTHCHGELLCPEELDDRPLGPAPLNSAPLRYGETL